MVEKVKITEFLLQSKEIPVIDVRSPAEFRQGHIPGADCLPLFDNDERAIVGTIFKNSGRDAAVLKGLELAGPKLAGFVKKMHSLAPKKEILLHCWRGGMRSEHMAWLFEQAGFRAIVLEGGYKSYRRFIRDALSKQAGIIIVGGFTGSGKTGILHLLEGAGEQVLDLEKLANHKGSVFGAFGQHSQPTNEQFENDIFSHWETFDLNRHIWIEDESRSIGAVNIPEPLFLQMNQAPMIMVETGKDERIEQLVNEYGKYDKSQLIEAVLKISEKLGGAGTKECLNALERNDLGKFTEIVLGYYDKAYMHSLSRRINQDIHRIRLEEKDPEKNACSVLKYMKEISAR